MSFLGFLSGADEMGNPQGFDIKKEDFEIKDADKIFGQTQTEFEAAKQRGAGLQGKRDAFLQTLQASAAGNGPSLAVEQMKMNQERNLSQQLAAAQGQRGASPGLAARSAANAAAANQAQIAQQGMQGRIEEQTRASKMLQSELQSQQEAVDALTQKYLSMGFDMRSAQQKALQAYNELQVQQTVGLASIEAQNQQARGQATGALSGGLIKGISSMLAPGGG